MSLSFFFTEIAPNRRAGCKNKECKDQDIKFEKGELRIGVYVTIQDFQSWHWKHWGCTTPQVIANINSTIEGDLELLDGYDELPEEDQARVSNALEEGHVADEDWKGVWILLLPLVSQTLVDNMIRILNAMW